MDFRIATILLVCNLIRNDNYGKSYPSIFHLKHRRSPSNTNQIVAVSPERPATRKWCDTGMGPSPWPFQVYGESSFQSSTNLQSGAEHFCSWSTDHFCQSSPFFRRFQTYDALRTTFSERRRESIVGLLSLLYLTNRNITTSDRSSYNMQRQKKTSSSLPVYRFSQQ